MSIYKIAALHQRTRGAVESRLESMGILPYSREYSNNDNK